MIIVKLCKKFISRGETVLVLANRRNHIDILNKHFSNNGIEPFIVTGVTKMKDRNFVRHDMENQQGKVILASTGVYSTGISIKKIHAIIFANAGKSKIQTMQSVGRGLRLHATKKKLHLYDIADDLEYSKEHLAERLQYYAKNNFEVEVKEIQL
jgi:superfamily II DNA or RNA helicase